MTSWAGQAMTRVGLLRERLVELEIVNGLHGESRDETTVEKQFLAHLRHELAQIGSSLTARSSWRWRFSRTSANVVWNRINHVEEQMCEHLETVENAVDSARLHAREHGLEDVIDPAHPRQSAL